MIQGKDSNRIKNLKCALDRRKARAGYPILPRNFTGDEVREYLGGDEIVCLLCGRSLKALGYHLYKIHGISPDEYRERYGLPYTKGIASESSRKAMGSATRKRLETDGGGGLAILARGHLTSVVGRPQRQPHYNIVAQIRRLEKINAASRRASERQVAKDQGRARYSSKTPCKNGHVGERMVANRGCVACLRAKKAAWAAANRDKVRAADARYRAAQRQDGRRI